MDRPVPASLRCYFEEGESAWTCVRCGLVIQKSLHPDRPFAACREGAKQIGVEYSPIVLASKMKDEMFSGPKPLSKQIGKPGTELKAMLGKLGIHAAAGCSCNQRAVIMDGWGPDLCEERMDSHIIPWLKEEATKRKLPFVEFAARALVRRAISKARKKLLGKNRDSGDNVA